MGNSPDSGTPLKKESRGGRERGEASAKKNQEPGLSFRVLGLHDSVTQHRMGLDAEVAERQGAKENTSA